MDPFHSVYRELTPEESKFILDIKETATTLYNLIAGDPAQAMDGMKARNLALAKTNLEQAVMWAVKGITG